MPEAEQTNPTILLHNFSDTDACIAIASGLLGKGFSVIAICSPGDDAPSGAARHTGCIVIEAGKGEALRAGLEHVNAALPQTRGAVWLDAGEGYTLSEILAVAYVSAANPDAVVLAARANGGVAGRLAAAERRLARLAFAAFHGRSVQDPWAGLMGLPAKHMAGFLAEKGTGGAYRFRLLLTMQRHGIRCVNVPLATACGRVDSETVKDRLGDIMKIVLMPLLFVSSSLMLTGADYCLNFLFFYVLMPGNKPVSIAVGRFTGALVGYLVNRRVVFKGAGGNRWAEAAVIAKYTALFAFLYCVALLLVSVMVDEFHLEYAVANVIAGVLLYAPNYLIQRDFVFKHRCNVRLTH
jgi:putative flippase GtrA